VDRPPIQPVILAGGGGTRLWPLSRGGFPKQFLALGGTHTLLQQTLQRVQLAGDTRTAMSAPVVVCNGEYRFFVLHQAREVEAAPGTIVLEPEGRNTAPAVTVAALLQPPGTVLAILPADHRIHPESGLAAALQAAAGFAQGGDMVVFGVRPDRAETGYGYLRAGAALASGDAQVTAAVLEAFREKPGVEEAGRLVGEGWLWNSGIFVFRADTWLDAIGRFEPEILDACRRAVAGATRDGAFLRLEASAFLECPSISVDNAVMERLGGDAPRAVLIHLPASWSDVGSWASLWKIMDADGAGNVIEGDICTIDSRNTAVHADHRLVAALGVEDLVIIETADAVLVMRRDRAQDVRQVVDWLREAGRPERLSHRRVYRPWGSYESLDHGERFQVKRIRVLPGHSLSLQMHRHRAEHWVVVRGTATVTRGTETFTVRENESTFIPTGVPHRLSNEGKIPLEIVEIQSGSYLGEDDIVRLEDNYGRN